MVNVPVTFAVGSSSGSYTLENLPNVVTGLSAKTDWNLRKKATSGSNLLDGSGQATINLALRGGDFNNTNSVNVLDYAVMKSSWGAGTAADLNGDGKTWLEDYAIMKLNWFAVGDPQ